MLFGVAFYSTAIGIISSFTQSKLTKKNIIMNFKLKNLNKVGDFLNVPKNLQEKLSKALEYSGSKVSYRWLRDCHDIFSDLSIDAKYQFLITKAGPINNSYL